jgi:hypothetical protein
MARKRALPRVEEEVQTQENAMTMLYRIGVMTNRQWGMFLTFSVLTGVAAGLLTALAV